MNAARKAHSLAGLLLLASCQQDRSSVNRQIPLLWPGSSRHAPTAGCSNSQPVPWRSRSRLLRCRLPSSMPGWRRCAPIRSDLLGMSRRSSGLKKTSVRASGLNNGTSTGGIVTKTG